MNKKRTLRKLDANAKWWIGTERPTDWLVEKNGDWWIIPDSELLEEEAETSKALFKKASHKGESNVALYWVILVLSGVLGISLALNFSKIL
jgi:hypothetical protein